MEFYYADGGAQRGPYPVADLAARGVTADTLVWREGMPDWRPARDVPEVRAALQGPTPAPAAPAGHFDAGARGAFAQTSVAPQPVGTGYPPAGYGAPTPQPIYPAAAYRPAPGQLQYGGYASVGTARPSGGMAIASLVLGILSFPLLVANCIGVLCAILAVVFGHIARGQARRGAASGAGMALAGLICGYVCLLIVAAMAVLFLIAVMAPNAKW